MTSQEATTKYKLKIKDGDKEVDEEIDVDTEKQTETYRIPKTDSENAGEVDLVYDFKKVKYYRQEQSGSDCISLTCTTGKAISVILIKSFLNYLLTSSPTRLC